MKYKISRNYDNSAKAHDEQRLNHVHLLYFIWSWFQTMGVQSKDRDSIKRRVKDMRTEIERDKKMQEKQQKAREKLEKQAVSSQTKKKKFPFGK